MSKRDSHAVEILPFITDIVCGSTKHTTCRVSKNGRNIAMPKVKQPNKTGVNGSYLKSGSAKWKTMTAKQKQYWDDIALKEDFWSRWTAFMSSFLISVGLHGLDHTMNNELSYLTSEKRSQRNEDFENSRTRHRQYQVDPSYYPRTEETLKTYQVAHDSPLVYVRLLDLRDVNNALRCKYAYRTDSIVEYRFFPNETGEVETGTYIKTVRERIGDELYELI